MVSGDCPSSGILLAMYVVLYKKSVSFCFLISQVGKLAFYEAL